MNQVVRDFHGDKIRIMCGEDDIQKEVYEKLIAPFASEFEYSWMTNTTAENHVKNYLSYVGSLMIRHPEEHNVVADRKLRKIKGMEIASDIVDNPKMKATIAPGKRNGKKSAKTNRLDKIRKKYPGARFDFCTVDTDGGFTHDGERYRVSINVGQYTSRPAGKDDLYYAMDKIIVVSVGSRRLYFDQNLEQVETTDILKGD